MKYKGKYIVCASEEMGESGCAEGYLDFLEHEFRDTT